MRVLLAALLGCLLMFSAALAQEEGTSQAGQESAQTQASTQGPDSVVEEGDSPRTPVGRLGAAFLILLGLLFCFFGQPWLKVLLGITGLLVGAATGYTLAGNIGLVGQLLVGVTIVAGLAGAALAIFFFWLSLFLLGAGFAGALFLLVLMALGTLPATTAVFQEPALLFQKLPWLSQLGLALSGLVGGLFTLWLQRTIIVLATSFCGALLLVVSGLSFTAWGEAELKRLEGLAPGTSFEFRWDALLLLAGWFFLGLLGALFQYHQLARRPVEVKAPAPTPPAAGSTPGHAHQEGDR